MPPDPMPEPSADPKPKRRRRTIKPPHKLGTLTLEEARRAARHVKSLREKHGTPAFDESLFYTAPYLVKPRPDDDEA